MLPLAIRLALSQAVKSILLPLRAWFDIKVVIAYG